MTPRFSWNQPICERCFLTRSPARVPVRMIDSDRETCVDCGWVTYVGIFIRIDPATAANPTRLKED